MIKAGSGFGQLFELFITYTGVLVIFPDGSEAA
jgi:hypothetical protein